MRFTTESALALAMASGLASAYSVDERSLLSADLSALTDIAKPVSAHIDIGHDLSGQVLVAGHLNAGPVGAYVGGDVNVGAGAAVGADVEVSVICNDCHTRGKIDASVSLKNVVPALDLTITDIEAKLDLDIKASAAANIAVNLLAAPVVDLPFLGLDLAATVFLDLVLGVSTSVDLSAGLEIELVDEATLSTNILTGDIISAAFSGLEVAVLPIEVRIGCTELHATLRLRVELDAGVKVDAGAVLPILDIVPEIGAGLELAVYVNLVEYVGLFCPVESCPVPFDSYGLNVGAIVGLDVAVENLAHIHLAPTVSLALLEAPAATHCPGEVIQGLPLGGGSTASITGTATATASITGTATNIISASVTGTASGTASITGTVTGPSVGTETGTEIENGSGNSGNAGSGNSGNAGSDNSGNAGSDNSGNAGSDNSGNAGSGNSGSGNSGSGNSGNAGPGNAGSDNSGNAGPGNAGSDNSGNAGSGNSGNAGSGNSGNAGSGNSGNAGPGNAGSDNSGMPSTSDTVSVPPGYVVSTVTQTATYTLTACAVNVPNCPGGYQGETTLVHTTVYTTVCPATASITEMYPKPTTTVTKEEPKTTLVITHTTAVPCSSVNTFVPPTYVPYPSSSFSASVPMTTAYSTSNVVYSTTEVKPTGSASTEEYPMESVTSATEIYPAKYPATETYPVEHPATETYPAEQPTTKPAYPTAPYYPSMPAPQVHHNGTTTTTAAYIPSTMNTYPVGPTGNSPTKPAAYPTVSYPVETPILTAGASKQVASGVVLAVAGVVAALF